jgi:hypothetical protein
MLRTVFLFCQYFYWMRLLQERLRFDRFRHVLAKDKFLNKVRLVGETLSEYPYDPVERLLPKGDDWQVFTLQQRAMGEAHRSIRASLLAELGREEWARVWPEDVIVRDGIVHFWISEDEPSEKRQALRVAAETTAGVRGVEEHVVPAPVLPAF